jgi:AcrR family transcriptional regulator
MERELLDRAAELFAQKGFAGTSLQDIANAARVGRTTLYHYFRSKDDFLTALVEDVTIRPSRNLHAIRGKPGASPRAQLREALEMLLAQVLERPLRFRVLDRDEHNLPPALLRRHEAAKRDVLAEVAAIIDAGILTGAFRPIDARVAALSLIGMCNWTAWWFNPAGKNSADEIRAQVAELAVNAVSRLEADRNASTPKAVLSGIRTNLDHLERLIEHPKAAD